MPLTDTVLRDINQDSITTLDLSGQVLNPLDIARLCDALQNNTSLTVINLSNTRLDNDSLSQLCDSMQGITGLRNLNISRNPLIDNSGVQPLVHLLNNRNSILQLDISHTNLTDGSARQLASIPHILALQTSFIFPEALAAIDEITSRNRANMVGPLRNRAVTQFATHLNTQTSATGRPIVRLLAATNRERQQNGQAELPAHLSDEIARVASRQNQP